MLWIWLSDIDPFFCNKYFTLHSRQWTCCINGTIITVTGQNLPLAITIWLIKTKWFSLKPAPWNGKLEHKIILPFDQAIKGPSYYKRKKTAKRKQANQSIKQLKCKSALSRTVILTFEVNMYIEIFMHYPFIGQICLIQIYKCSHL